MKKVVAILVITAVICAFASPAFAAGGRSLKEDAKTAGRAAVNYPANVANESVKTVGRAAYGTAETAVSPLKAFWRTLIGKGRPEDVVVSPVKRGGETIRDAAVDTAETPYRAGKRRSEQSR